VPLNFWKSSAKAPERPHEDMVGYLEPSIELEGRIRVMSGMVRLNSQFKGEITSQGTVVVAGQGEVEATITAKLVSIAGKVKGNIHASDRLEIKEHGVVLGEIYTRVLVVEPGGYFEGQCHMPATETENREASARPGVQDQPPQTV
jgi:cytoskeletal protein CcmA (bactofilin family)